MPAPGKSYPAAYLWGRVGGTDGIFLSDDAGKTWRRINGDRHQFGGINDLTGDPRVHGRVYLGTSGRGVVVGEP
jgi:xyloglucan-specific exo-beta-1,4-glucanase